MSVAVQAVRRLRATRPATADHLWDWVHAFTGIRIARTEVCRDHCSPFHAFADQWLNRPAISLELGPRGGGKSFLAAIKTHLDSRFNGGFGTRILGGSAAQSLQIYNGLTEAIVDGAGDLGGDAASIHRLLRQRATYRNKSEVSILAASATSVRGPHVPSLRLDEVDEIDPDLRESAVGIATGKKGGPKATVAMTSTWHRLGGPMETLIDEAKAGKFPLYTYCAFEVLETCPESRSGPHLENCPDCPIRRWCHADRDVHGGVPKAKRSDGHLSIDGLIQKATLLSKRAFEADYLCLGPKADGIWFKGFDEAIHKSETAEYDPKLPVHLAIDSGVWTGAVWFQVRPDDSGGHRVAVFADYLSESLSAESNALAILAVGRERCQGRRDRAVTDPAGGSRNPVGPTVLAEYERSGLRLISWPLRGVSDGLELIESFLSPADGKPRLHVHPRCKHLIRAFAGYRRAERAGQWMDWPCDPNHPHEDLMDALRGGLVDRFPEGRKPDKRFIKRHARDIF